MKKILGLIIAVAALASATSTRAFTFTQGNIVVYRVGTASATLTNIGSQVFLDEYTTNGDFVQSLPLPTNYFGGYSPVLADGSASSEGLLTRSVDGRFIVFTGYGSTIGQVTNEAVSSTTAANISRVVGLADQFGHIDTTTVQTNSLADDETIRTAVSTDGTNIWLSGGSSGIRYTTRGSFLATQVCSTADGGPAITNLRQINIYSNQIYFTDASGSSIRIGVVQNGQPPTSTNALPTVGGAVQTNLNGTPVFGGSPYGFALLNTHGTDPDTLYFCDDGFGIYKYSLVGSTWTSNGNLIASGAGVRCMTGRFDPSSGSVHLFITTAPSAVPGQTFVGGGFLIHYVDTAGWNQAPTGSGGDLFNNSDQNFNSGNVEVNPPNNSVFRGVVFAPVGGETFPVPVAGYLSVGPNNGFFSSGLSCGPFTDPSEFTQAFSLANPGTSTINWSGSADSNWVALSQSSGSITSGGSVTVIASLNGNANSLLAGTNTADIFFNNTTSVTGSITQQVRLILVDQTVRPTGSFSSSGSPGGPFTPTSQIYTISNGCSTITWSANLNTNFFTLSPPSGTLNPGQGVDITVSVNNGVDVTLLPGSYSDTVTFSNTTAGSVIATRVASISPGFAFFFDDFSTYTTGPLVGQNGWVQNALGGAGGSITVAGGKAFIPGGVNATGQWLEKSFPTTTNPTVYAGMSMVVTNVSSTNANYFTTLFQFNNGTLGTPAGFTLYEVAASSPDIGLSNFVFSARTSQQTGTPYTNGPTYLPIGSTIRVIYQHDINGSNTTVYVNPTSSNVGAQTPYLVAKPSGGFTPDPGVGSIGLRINAFNAGGTLSGGSSGIGISRLAVSTNFADVYNWITPAPPFQITSITKSGNNIVLVWNTLVGNNIVQVSSGIPAAGSYTNGNFTGIFTNAVGSVGTATFTDVGAGTNKPSRYYRIDLHQ